jgi:hypothetical protein
LGTYISGATPRDQCPTVNFKFKSRAKFHGLLKKISPHWKKDVHLGFFWKNDFGAPQKFQFQCFRNKF